MINPPHWVEQVLKWIGALTLIGAPLSGCVRYLKSRTYAVRLEPSITAEILRADGEVFLRITPKVKNIGSSRVILKPSNSYVRICVVESGQASLTTPLVEPIPLMTIEVLSDVNQLESAEAEEDAKLVKMPHDNYLAFHLEFGITSDGIGGTLGGRDWTRNTILNCKLNSGEANSSA